MYKRPNQPRSQGLSSLPPLDPGNEVETQSATISQDDVIVECLEYISCNEHDELSATSLRLKHDFNVENMDFDSANFAVPPHIYGLSSLLQRTK